MEDKQFRVLKLNVKNVTEAGEFEGYASTRDKDQGGDIILEGAFKRTIEQNGGEFPILWFHDPTQPIGLGVVKEDGHGLYTKGRLNLDKQLARDVHSDMKFGVVDRMSIGYVTVTSEWDDEKQARLLSEVRLFEYSLITKNFSMNEQALVTAVKRRDPTFVNAKAVAQDNLAMLRGMVATTELSIAQAMKQQAALLKLRHTLSGKRARLYF